MAFESRQLLSLFHWIRRPGTPRIATAGKSRGVAGQPARPSDDIVKTTCPEKRTPQKRFTTRDVGIHHKSIFDFPMSLGGGGRTGPVERAERAECDLARRWRGPRRGWSLLAPVRRLSGVSARLSVYRPRARGPSPHRGRPTESCLSAHPPARRTRACCPGRSGCAERRVHAWPPRNADPCGGGPRRAPRRTIRHGWTRRGVVEGFRARATLPLRGTGARA